MTKITTDRLLIRDFIPDDLEAFHEVKSNDEIMYYLPKMKRHSLKDTRADLDDAIAQSKLEKGRERYFYAIEYNDTGEFVGSIGYNVIDRSGDGMTMGLGYFIGERFWRLGIVSEAARALFEYAFNNGVYKISMGCVTANVASERIMQRLGMKRVRYLKDHSEIHGKLYDRVGYMLTRDEWENKNRGH